MRHTAAPADKSPNWLPPNARKWLRFQARSHERAATSSNASCSEIFRSCRSISSGCWRWPRDGATTISESAALTAMGSIVRPMQKMPAWTSFSCSRNRSTYCRLPVCGRDVTQPGCHHRLLYLATLVSYRSCLKPLDTFRSMIRDSNGNLQANQIDIHAPRVQLKLAVALTYGDPVCHGQTP